MEIKTAEYRRLHEKTECHVVGILEEETARVSGGVLSGPDRSKIQAALKSRGYKGSFGEDILLAGIAVDGCPAVLALGLGKPAAYTHERLRRSAARVFARAKRERWAHVRLDYETLALKESDAYSASAITEGILLAAYRFDDYKSEKKNGKDTLKTVELSFRDADDRKKAAAAAGEARVICEGVALARTLGNEPANVLYPESYAARIKKIALDTGLKCTVFDEKRLARLKMGGILGVGRGSARKPRLVIIEYRPKQAKSKKPVALVGKGVTFDTGGISIKPSKDMDHMKFDMCGSAAVMAAVATAARLKLPVPVVGLAPLAENMPGGGAQRPGDVLTCYNGKTVDVLNTDAEGRLVLADALAYAKNFEPRCVVDIATLTGLCAHFFDHAASGLMGTDADLVRRLKAAGERTGERLWELPLWDDYEEMIKGGCGDIQNISRATAGTITAGMFLKHFGAHAPWAHLDIAGTAWTTSERNYNPAGATGVGVRLFIEFLKSYL